MTAMYHLMHYLLLQELAVFFLNGMILEPVHLFENFYTQTHVNVRIPVTLYAAAATDRRNVLKFAAGRRIGAGSSWRGRVEATLLIVTTIETGCMGTSSTWMVR
jgi:hypothetical protein